MLCERIQYRAALATSDHAPGGRLLSSIDAARDLLRNASLPSSAPLEEALLASGVEVLAGRLFESISMQVCVPAVLIC